MINLAKCGSFNVSRYKTFVECITKLCDWDPEEQAMANLLIKFHDPAIHFTESAITVVEEFGTYAAGEERKKAMMSTIRLVKDSWRNGLVTL